MTCATAIAATGDQLSAAPPVLLSVNVGMPRDVPQEIGYPPKAQQAAVSRSDPRPSRKERR